MQATRSSKHCFPRGNTVYNWPPGRLVIWPRRTLLSIAVVIVSEARRRRSKVAGGSLLPVYSGRFGPEQAERLLWRAGFGPRPGEAAKLAAARACAARSCR